MGPIPTGPSPSSDSMEMSAYETPGNLIQQSESNDPFRLGPTSATGPGLNVSSNTETSQIAPAQLARPTLSATEQYRAAMATATPGNVSQQPLESSIPSISGPAESNSQVVTTAGKTTKHQQSSDQQPSQEPQPDQTVSQQPSLQSPAPSTPKPAPILTFAQAMRDTEARGGVFSALMADKQGENSQRPSSVQGPSITQPIGSQPQAASSLFGQPSQQQPLQSQAPNTSVFAESRPQAASNIFGQLTQQQTLQAQAPSASKSANSQAQAVSYLFGQPSQQQPLQAQSPGASKLFGSQSQASNTNFGQSEEPPKAPEHHSHLRPLESPAAAQSQDSSNASEQSKEQQLMQNQASTNSEDAHRESAEAQPLSNAMPVEQRQVHPPSNLFGQQQLPGKSTSGLFSQPQVGAQPTFSGFGQQQGSKQSTSSIFGQQQEAKPSISNIFGQQQESKQATSNIFSQQPSIVQEQQQSVKNGFGQGAPSNIFGQQQAQKQSPSNSVGQQQKNNMFPQQQPQATESLFTQQQQPTNNNIFSHVQPTISKGIGQPQQLTSSNIFGQVKPQAANNLFGKQEQHGQQPAANVFGQLQQANRDVPGNQLKQAASSNFAKSGQNAASSLFQRDEEQQNEQNNHFANTSLDQSPNTQTFRKVDNPFLASVDTFMSEMVDVQTQDTTDLSDEDMHSSDFSPERRRPDDHDQESTCVSGNNNLSSDQDTAGSVGETTAIKPGASLFDKIARPGVADQNLSQNQPQVVSSVSGYATGPKVGGSLFDRITRPEAGSQDQTHVNSEAASSNMSFNKATQNGGTTRHLGEQLNASPVPATSFTSPLSNGITPSSQSLASDSPLPSKNPSGTINVQSTSQSSASFTPSAPSSADALVSSPSKNYAVGEEQGKKTSTRTFPTTQNRNGLFQALGSPGNTGTCNTCGTCGAPLAIPVDFPSDRNRQVITRWRLRFLDRWLWKQIPEKASAADKVLAVTYYEWRKKALLAVTEDNSSSIAGSKRKAGDEDSVAHGRSTDGPIQKRSKSTHLPNGTSSPQRTVVNEPPPASSIRGNDNGLATEQYAIIEPDIGKTTEKRKDGEGREINSSSIGREAYFENQSETPKRRAELELSRADPDKSKKPRLGKQSETSNIFRNIVGKKNKSSEINGTEGNDITPSSSSSHPSQSESATNAVAVSETPTSSGEPSSITAKPSDQSPAFKVPAFGTAGSSNWTAQFGKTAAKSAEQLAKEEKAKRKAEEFDSDEDDEAEWERQYEERQRAKRQNLEKVKATGTKLVNGRFVFASTADTEASQTNTNSSNDFVLSKPTVISTESVFNQTVTSLSNSHNIFSHLSGDNDGSAGGKKTSGTDGGDDDIDDGDIDGGTDDREQRTQARAGKLREKPFGFLRSATPENSQNATNSPKQSSLGSLFDRISRDDQGNVLREAPHTLFSSVETGSAAVKKAPFGTLNHAGEPEADVDAAAESSRDGESRISNRARTPDSSFRSLGSTSSPPSLQITSPGLTKQPLTGLFGKPNKDGTVEAPAQPVSVLFSKTSSQAPSMGFNFGFSPFNPALTGLAPPSTEGSRATSRTTSPDATTGESANESAIEAEEIQVGADEQIDLTASGPGEEHDDLQFEVKGKAMVYDRPSSKWEVKGVGFLRVLKDRTTSKTRMILRQHPTGRVLLNAGLAPQFRYESHQDKHVRLPFVNERGMVEAWVLKVGKDEDAKTLSGVLESNKSS